MNFAEHMLPVDRRSVFRLEGYEVWCGSMLQGEDGRYYLYFSFWPSGKGHDAWVTHSQVGFAVADQPEGPYHYGGIALAGAGGDAWDRDVIHNPTVLAWEGRYYLYYMGNYGNGEYWDHRNHQRVGVAWADRPEGPWYRMDRPLIDTTPGTHDALLTSNPTVTRAENGQWYMVYKAVSDAGEMPKGGAVVCGVAVAGGPLGPFVKHERPVMCNPENPWSVEDPFIWFQDGMFYALVKDFQGYFSKGEKGSVALFVSADGMDWQPDAEHPLAFRLRIAWADGMVQPVARLERPQLWLEEGKPRMLFCACMEDAQTRPSYNVHIPLHF